MPIQNYSYHTHTNLSDGHNTPDEMMAQAVKLGWKELGISDHMIIHKNIFNGIAKADFIPKSGHIFFDNFDKAYEYYARSLEALRIVSQKYPLNVSLGYEIDYFIYDDWAEYFDKLMDRLDCDYVISGNHYLCSADGLNIVERFNLSKYVPNLQEQKEWLSRHFATIVKAINSHQFSFIAHIDFLRSLDFCGEFGFQEERREILKALAETNTPFELSSKGFRKGVGFYPASWMLEEAKALNIPVIISDDAHNIEELGNNFEVAENLLKELDYTNRWIP